MIVYCEICKLLLFIPNAVNESCVIHSCLPNQQHQLKKFAIIRPDGELRINQEYWGK